MSRLKFRTVADYEYALEMKASWGPIVQAAGLYNDQQSGESVFLLAGAIIKDRILLQRYCAAQSEHVPKDKESPWQGGLYETLLAEMTESEREALRNRVLARFGRK